MMKSLTEQVKDLARKYRMDLVGVAPIERYAHAPEMVHPRAHLPEAHAVIAMAIRYPDAMFVNAGTSHAESIFSIETYQNLIIGRNLYHAALRVTRMLEDRGWKTIPMPVSGKWRIHPYKSVPTNWCADFSNRHAAVAAGLGEFGIHALAITPQFGMRQRFISIITEAPLDPDPMYAGPSLCDRCMKCFKACPVKAIDPRPKVLEKVVIGERTFEYAKVDHWRCAWSEQVNMIPEEGPAYAGQDKGVAPPPDGDIDDAMFLDAFSRKNRIVGLQGGMTHAMGNCMRVCIPPTLRGKQAPVEDFCAGRIREFREPDARGVREYQLAAMGESR
jgi:ferredoxin